MGQSVGWQWRTGAGSVRRRGRDPGAVLTNRPEHGEDVDTKPIRSRGLNKGNALGAGISILPKVRFWAMIDGSWGRPEIPESVDIYN